MISRTCRGGFEDWLDEDPDRREAYNLMKEAGWTDQQIVGQFVRAIQAARNS